MKPFGCHLCDYKAATKKQLNEHQLTHTGAKPFSCTECDYASTNKGNLNAHMKRKHPGQS